MIEMKITIPLLFLVTQFERKINCQKRGNYLTSILTCNLYKLFKID